jgi:hypothetical protein
MTALVNASQNSTTSRDRSVHQRRLPHSRDAAAGQAALVGLAALLLGFLVALRHEAW